eukprot:TRINITY_DN330_c1_g1_i10.p2 TRINITY_DN330_c1_g1~~TRINITY_DN330_c1_g1_i10.p2  ORF type:complete len:100 (-),score=23.34 TRINITY_DN330_c1_g1_i10:1387-1686(-)
MENCRRFDADCRTIIFGIHNKIWSDLLNLEDGLVISAHFLNSRYRNQFLTPAMLKIHLLKIVVSQGGDKRATEHTLATNIPKAESRLDVFSSSVPKGVA